MGVPLDMASTAGSEKPSYSDGMHEISAEASSAASSASDSPLEMCTISEMPSSAIRFSVGPLGSSFATSCSSTSRSVQLGDGLQQVRHTPGGGTSALAMAMIRPGTRGRWGSEQLGVHAERNDVQLIGDAEVVGDIGGRKWWTRSAGRICRATSFCISANPYQRCTSGLRHQFGGG